MKTPNSVPAHAEQPVMNRQSDPALWMIRIAALFLLGAAGAGCAADPNNPDPHEKINRVSYKINEGFDRFILKPVSDVYVKVIPRPARTGIGNAFDNLAYGNVILNDMLQGRFDRGLGGIGHLVADRRLQLRNVRAVGQFAHRPPGLAHVGGAGAGR